MRCHVDQVTSDGASSQGFWLSVVLRPKKRLKIWKNKKRLSDEKQVQWLHAEAHALIMHSQTTEFWSCVSGI